MSITLLVPFERNGKSLEEWRLNGLSLEREESEPSAKGDPWLPSRGSAGDNSLKAAFSLILAKVFECKSRVLQNLVKQSLRNVPSVDGDHESLASGVFQNQVRTSLAGFAISLP